MSPLNQHGQPIGEPLVDWVAPPFPPPNVLEGRTVILEPLDWSVHGERLFETFSTAPDGLWTYMTFGPFSEISEFKTAVESMLSPPDWLPYAIVVDGKPLGFVSYLRIKPAEGVLEIGAITFSPELQRSTAATEAIYLLLANAFHLGYRRCEWKCDDLNEPSRVAGARLGFTYEGTFRRATHYKGRNRDTAWFAIIDSEWGALDRAFRSWLSPENFDEAGTQRQSLSSFIAVVSKT